MANVSNSTNGTLISSSSSADTLKNWGKNVTIDAAAGNDTIYNGGDNVSIDGGAGKDSVTNWGANVTLDGGDNADNLINCGDTTTVKGGKGTDSIFNQGANVSIDAGDDADNIQNISSRVTINGGAGNDTIANPSDEVTIAGGADNDSVYNDGSRASIDLGAGKDSIQNSGSKVAIDGNAGIDLINNFGIFVSISGGDDNDSIGNWTGGDYSELDGGAGNDSIYNNGGSYVTINGGAGKDSITNWNENVSIDGGADNDSISNHASNVTIGGNTGNDEIINRADSVTIDGGANDDEISNYNAKVSITGGADNDSLYNEGSFVTLDGGAGNDTITNRGTVYRDSSGVRTTVSPDNVSIYGGTGDDVLINTGESNVSLKGGSNVSLNGGAGNDTLIGSANAEIFIYENGGGFDVIKNYSAEDTVKIASGKIGDISVSDTDVIFTIGDGSLTLKNMQGRTVTITDADGNTTTKRYGATSYSAQDAIKNLVKAWSQTFLSDTAKLDESIKLSTQYNGIQDAIDHMVADCQTAGDADTFLRKYCGIILDNADTGAITGWDAGGVSIKTADEIVDETLPASQVRDYKDFTFTTSQGVDIHISSSGSSLNANGKKVFDGLYSWWADNSIKLIEESYGVSFSDSVSIDVSMVKSASYAGNTTRDTVKINQGNITFEDSDDYNGNGMDRTIAHEFTHVAQNLFMGGQFPQFLMEGLADLTHGIDDRGGKTELLSSIASNADSLSSYLDLNNSGTGSAPYYVAGFMFYRYLARQASFSYDSLTAHAWEDKAYIKGTDNAELITGNGNNQTLAAGKGNDTITSYGKNAVFEYNDGDGNDSIIGFDETSMLLVRGNGHSTMKSGKNIIVTVGDGKITLNGATNLSKVNIIDAEDEDPTLKVGTEGNDDIENTLDGATIQALGGNDTITNSGSNVSINGGASKDYISNEGISTTIDGGSNNDKISNSGAKVLLFGGTGKDTITNSGASVSIDGGADNDKISNTGAKVSIFGGTGNDSVKNTAKSVEIFGGDGNDTIVNSKGASVTIDAGAGNDRISNSGGSVSIIGGAGTDSIKNTATKVTIMAGAGDDTITNSGKNALIKYADGDGNDLITGFNTTSKLQIGDGKGTYNTEKVGEDVIVTVGEGQITLQGAAGLWIDSVDGGLSNIAGTFQAPTLILDDKSASPVIIGDKIELVDASARKKAIKITGNALDNSIVSGSSKDSLYGGDGSDTLNGGANNDKLYGQAGDDSLYGGTGNDYLSGGDGEDTLWGGTGADTLIGGADADVFVYSGGKDVIKDYVSGEDVISLGAAYSNASINGNDVVLTVGNGRLTIKNAKYQAITFLDGEEDYHIECPGVLTADNSTKTPLTIGKDVEFVDATARTTAFKVTGNELNNTILGGSGKDSLYGGKGTDSLLGGKGNDKLYGQDGEDTLWGGAGNDTLKGGADDDLFIYSGGKDVITDYVSGEDVISLGAAYTKASISGNDVILTIKKNNTLTIKNAKYEEITFINAKGEEYTETFGGGKLDDDSEAKQTLGKGVEFVDATSRNKAIEITGNELNNTILGGAGRDTIYGMVGADYLDGGNDNDVIYGGDGDDTLIGGKGNDKLWGGNGADTFVYNYGDGKDTIYEFKSNDMLEITGATFDAYYDNDGYIYINVGDTKNAITFSSSSITTNIKINGDTYVYDPYEGSKLVKS